MTVLEDEAQIYEDVVDMLKEKGSRTPGVLIGTMDKMNQYLKQYEDKMNQSKSHMIVESLPALKSRMGFYGISDSSFYMNVATVLFIVGIKVKKGRLKTGEDVLIMFPMGDVDKRYPPHTLKHRADILRQYITEENEGNGNGR